MIFQSFEDIEKRPKDWHDANNSKMFSTYEQIFPKHCLFRKDSFDFYYEEEEI